MALKYYSPCHHYTWRNFGLRLLRLVNRLYTVVSYSQDTKVLNQSFTMCSILDDDSYSVKSCYLVLILPIFVSSVCVLQIFHLFFFVIRKLKLNKMFTYTRLTCLFFNYRSNCIFTSPSLGSLKILCITR